MKKTLLALSCLTLSASLLPGAEDPPRCGPRPTLHALDDALALALGRNTFAFDFNRRLAHEYAGNMIWSPTSMHNAFMTLYAGAEGTTAEALEQVLALPGSDSDPWSVERVYQAYETLQEVYLTGDQEGGELSLTEAMFMAEDFPFRRELVAFLEEARGVDSHSVDFNDPATVALINQWVEEQTRGMIPAFLEPGDLDPDAKLAVLNTMYFASDWESPFLEALTAPKPFYVHGGVEPVSVPTMHAVQHGRVFRNDVVTLVELSYDRYGTSMLIALPAEGKSGMSEVLRTLDAETLEQWLDEAEYFEFTIDLPRFSLGGETMNLTQTLRAGGLGVLFGTGADLTGFGGVPGELTVDSVLHACKVEVDEQGTVAAAVSAILLKDGAAAISPPAVSVQVDRPFLFMVREGRSGEILVMGRVEDPRGESQS